MKIFGGKRNGEGKGGLEYIVLPREEGRYCMGKGGGKAGSRDPVALEICRVKRECTRKKPRFG
jgi:hypothetical protein